MTYGLVEGVWRKRGVWKGSPCPGAVPGARARAAALAGREGRGSEGMSRGL